MPSTETFRGEGEIGNNKIIPPAAKKAYFRYLPQPPGKQKIPEIYLLLSNNK